MGGVLTNQALPQKWTTKIFSKVTLGGMGIGRSCGYLIYRDRYSGNIEQENIPVFARIGIRLMYRLKTTDAWEERDAIKRVLHCIGTA
jgi:hypothetical protein